MCGIYGYIRPKELKDGIDPVDVCLEGLSLLEYRGYDSAGIAGIIDGKIKSCKRAGKVHSLKTAVEQEKLRLDTAIAHTRWATHGIPNQENAHPHFDQKETLAVVHNGIIENHSSIREKLEAKGVVFQSDTDSEVIAQLVSYLYKGNLRIAVQAALKQLHGSLAIAIIHVDHPNQIVAASRESPLVIGIDREKGEAYLSSDANSLVGKSLEVIYLKNDEIAILDHSHVEVFNGAGKKVAKKMEKIGIESSQVTKNGFEHFMLKEIFEQPQTIQQAMYGRTQEEFGTAVFEELNLDPKELQSIDRVLILGCGTSWHAGCIAASLLENIARIPTEVEIASEFRYTNPIISEGTLVIAISQSGETADTVAAVREAKAKGAKVIGICNVNHSTIARESDSCIFLNAGIEVSVCSTKAFTSQLTVLALFTLFMARIRHLDKEEGQNFLKELRHLPTKVTQVLSQADVIERFAEKYASFEQFFFLGRRYMFPTSLEAALKLKEISYLNACGYPAGEMKHGPLALVSPKLAVIGMCGNMQTIDKILSNLMEVKARGGQILAFAPKGIKELEKITSDILYLPKVSDFLASIPYSVAGQLFAYCIAKRRGTEIDQPRNLAKSVTVE
ncbi:glutamine--fructose-6-phosphate transaminase (isomerizing) [Simkania negevensis]|uniref:Glutamine--fructose-6-phosphate aminotransferase [isomerizing] n=1 Tax=Simkania negevensis (strain ATCC VR-1471 / DSM 27360 / Z) TaxID=331113 RepID=F8L8R1_SIMNZ|nr:glutamine--fructose-6-phosphate transaminase (isomerizing) [Simkania negevensis]CCB89204.1 glucosamine--fructose-6-phosphate aminotransferase [isomerizing] [Simkania negevensis Z]